LEEELNSAANKLGLDPKVELSQYLSHKIIEKNNDHIAHEEFTQRDLNLLEHEIIKKTEEKDEILKIAGEVGKKLIGTNKEIQLTLNRLSVEQVKIEKEIRLKEEACNKKMLEMDSMRLLKAIVSEIAVDATEKFSVLSESINKYLSVILDKNSNIKFTGFTNLDDVQCLDHYDHVREANQLSSGTKDALVLAARLALLEKVDLQKDAFLILDDPFVLMDYERQNKAIKALKKFYDDTKMAIVVFTKDQTVRDMVKAQFGGAETVELHR
jgi:DNA repair exonuclease SbcCD ATPase subunit